MTAPLIRKLLGTAAITAAYMAFAAPASATECLLDSDGNGTASAGDTDGGATSDGTTTTLACGTAAAAGATNATAVGTNANAPSTGSTAVGFNATVELL